jgi:hypothetical protein
VIASPASDPGDPDVVRTRSGYEVDASVRVCLGGWGCWGGSSGREAWHYEGFPARFSTLPVLTSVGFVLSGLLLIAVSRAVADGFRIRGNTSVMAKFVGMADDYVSRLYRWVVCVVTGFVFVAVGTITLFSG